MFINYPGLEITNSLILIKKYIIFISIIDFKLYLKKMYVFNVYCRIPWYFILTQLIIKYTQY